MERIISIASSPCERNEVSRRLGSLVRGRSQRLLGAMGIGEAISISVTSLIGPTEADLKALIAQKEACLRAIDPHHPLLSVSDRNAMDDWRAAA